MDKATYTTGPWYVGAQNDGLFIIDQPPRPAPADHPADIPGVTIIGVVYDNVFDDAGASQGTANARLIAAAPDLVEALVEGLRFIEDWMNARGYPEHVEDWCDMHGEADRFGPTEPDSVYAKRDRLRAALSKALGRTVTK